MKSYLLLGIVLLAAALRLWGLAENPPSLTADEAALGYNAFSIFKSGRDEHGELFPIIFKSFGDWKPGLYVYLTVPFVALFGLNEFSVRLVGALSGIVAVYLIYLLTKKLYGSDKMGLGVSFVLATLPWHIHFSRGAWEINLAFTLLLAGLLFFLKGIEKDNNYIYISAIFFGLTYWSYQGAKLATTLVLIGLIVFYSNELLKLSRKVKITAFIILLLLIAPIGLSLAQGKGGRLEVFSVFSYPRSKEYINSILMQEIELNPQSSFRYTLYHSETLNFARGILGRFLNHYSPRFLFIDGDWSNLRHASPNIGQLLLIQIVLLIAGLSSLAKLKTKREAMFIWFLLVTLSLPSALSRDSVHAVRSYNLILPIVLILSLGFDYVYQQRGNYKNILLTVYSMLYLLNMFYYLDAYFIHMPKKASQDWGYGLKQVVESLIPYKEKVSEIVIKQSYAQPYIYYLFYSKFDPVRYQELSRKNYLPNGFGDVGLVSSIENITFREVSWGEDKQLRDKIYVVETNIIPNAEYDDPKKYKIIKEVKYLNNQPAYTIVQTL